MASTPMRFFVFDREHLAAVAPDHSRIGGLSRDP
jgi:hypothetical protein